ncbi:t43.3 [Tupaiid betaherpesvirus 1]|uniref:T43.3 n=1 Tax=Tupaiid herpesvirus 1 (strain 1) TaxID=10397 RepID=Q91TP7_TUHV1|nr:t43.3 [Tupaiid betaherpesvirus 1]AAK57090.1 t43.3 [Tupaiid betaherpesvirus 1]
MWCPLLPLVRLSDDRESGRVLVLLVSLFLVAYLLFQDLTELLLDSGYVCGERPPDRLESGGSPMNSSSR